MKVDCKHCPFGLKKFDALICPDCYNDEEDISSATYREIQEQNLFPSKHGDK